MDKTDIAALADRDPCSPIRYQTPVTVHGIFAFFDTGGRFWTPEWDATNKQGRTVKKVQMRDGSWHEFDRFVSRAEATTFRITGRTTAPSAPATPEIRHDQ